MVVVQFRKHTSTVTVEVPKTNGLICPRCVSAHVHYRRWHRVENWKTVECMNCGFKFDYDADQLIEPCKVASRIEEDIIKIVGMFPADLMLKHGQLGLVPLEEFWAFHNQTCRALHKLRSFALHE